MAGPASGVAPLTERHRELLERHLPLLRNDPQEPFLACSAQTIVANPGNALLRDGRTPVASAGEGERPLSLELLATDPERTDGDRLNEAGDEHAIERDALRLQADPRFADRVYGRAYESGGRTYLQYWFWLYYNPKDVLGGGRHEGDWEMIQLTLEGDAPKVATYAQHDHSYKEAWERVERHEERHPVVYVAAESHASYFESGTHRAFGAADNAYGDGRVVLPQVEELGPWALWPGRWGNSTGIGSRLPTFVKNMFSFLRNPPAGRSPKSPGNQNPKWDDPPEFERAAHQRVPLHDQPRWQRGKKSYPFAPEIVAATVSGDVVTVRYRKAESRPGRHLLVTVNAPGQQGELLAREPIARAPREGEVRLKLSRTPDDAVVLMSAFNRSRQRSDVASAAISPA